MRRQLCFIIPYYYIPAEQQRAAIWCIILQASSSSWHRHKTSD